MKITEPVKAGPESAVSSKLRRCYSAAEHPEVHTTQDPRMMSLVELSKSFNTFSHRLFFWRGLGGVLMALVHVSLFEMKVPSSTLPSDGQMEGSDPFIHTPLALFLCAQPPAL